MGFIFLPMEVWLDVHRCEQIYILGINRQKSNDVNQYANGVVYGHDIEKYTSTVKCGRLCTVKKSI